MATFEVKVYQLRIEEHPNADTLELAVVGDYRSCVRKGQFKTGDLGVYIPEGAVLPERLIEQLGLVGKLAGPDHNRVKAIKLRGILSQGLICPMEILEAMNPLRKWNQTVGVDVAGWLEVTKYEPPIPTHMNGEVWNAWGHTLKYDIENIKKFPDVLQEDEWLFITEKLHGTWTCFGYDPTAECKTIVTSKGLSGQGLAFKLNEANENNLYIRSLASTVIDGKTALDRLREVFVPGLKVYILGETFGKGVQDLDYGLTKPAFRAFDIWIEDALGVGRYLNPNEFTGACRTAQIETVPVLWRGEATRAQIEEFTNGKDNITGGHIREGVVIRPLEERRDDTLGRVILKSVSEAYLLRKGNATEFN
jgi:RNA ligase (TIGR02306 family)